MFISSLLSRDEDKADVVAAELSCVGAGVEILIWAKALLSRKGVRIAKLQH